MSFTAGGQVLHVLAVEIENSPWMWWGGELKVGHIIQGQDLSKMQRSVSSDGTVRALS